MTAATWIIGALLAAFGSMALLALGLWWAVLILLAVLASACWDLTRQDYRADEWVP